MERKVIIGIPVKNDLESFKAMLDSLLESTKTFNEIFIAVGKGTDKETEEYLTTCTTNLSFFKISGPRFDTPLEAYNYLFDYARAQQADLLLTQTDVIFPKLYKRDWLEYFRAVAQNPMVGAVVPINGGGMSGPRWINGFKWVGAWCTYFPYNTILSIGNYDENYLIGDGVDIDYSYRIYIAGLHILTANYWVDHHMMNNRSDEGKYTHEKNEEFKRKNGEYFRNKFKLNKGPYYKKEVKELYEEK